MVALMIAQRPIRTFKDFYPCYLDEHRNRTSRRLHFVGSSLAILLGVLALLTRHGWLAAALIQAYALAWVGHFFFEHNKPATFKHPWFSFLGDWHLWWDIVTGKSRL
jgi:hypothetical protein